MARLSDFELGWLVGILEGEGCFYMNGNSKPCPYVQVKMTDEDSVNQVAALFERITDSPVSVLVEDKSRENPLWQHAYVVRVGGDKARAIMRLVVKHMKYRRRQKVWQCLNGFKPETISTGQLLTLIKGA